MKNRMSIIIRLMILTLVIVSLPTTCFAASLQTDANTQTLSGRRITYHTREAHVFIFDLETMEEATPAIYNSYESYLKNSESVMRDVGGEWPFADTTIVSVMYMEQNGLYFAYGATMESYAGYAMQTLSSRVRLYNTPKNQTSISDTPLADSGNVTESYSSSIRATATTNQTAVSAIGVVGGYCQGYGSFSYNLRADF